MDESVRDVIYKLTETFQKGDTVEVIGSVLAGSEGVVVSSSGNKVMVKMTKLGTNIAKQYSKVGDVATIKDSWLTKV